jgi:menaquinone-dependent protoporphyrinogen oxidase
MASVLLLYATGEGQTEKVAGRIADLLEPRGHEVTLLDARRAPGDLSVEEFDAVLVGSSIHMGTHPGRVREFVRTEREALARRPSAFFQVCLSAASEDPERRAEADRYVEEFVAETGWRPDRTVVFAGALRYSRYGFLKRAMMKRIAAESTGDTDTGRDYEYTDWDAVERFAAAFADLVEAESGDHGRGDEPRLIV